VRKEFAKLTHISDADQSTNQSTSKADFKSFAHIETSSEEICGTIEALMNANCSKFAADKTIQKICSSSSSKDIDVTLNQLSMSESPEEDDMRNVTTSMLHTTTTPHKAMLHAAATPLKPLAQPQSEFNLQFLPPLRSESERDLRRLIDECVEEKERVETALAALDKCLAKIQENQETIEAMKKGERKGEKGDGDSAAVKAKIKKIEKEIQALRKKEKEREKEEAALKKKLLEFQGEEEDNKENCLREEEILRKTTEHFESRLEIIEALTSWPVQDQS